MKWTQESRYFWRRECGRYFVERSNVLGEWIYLAWFKPHTGWRRDEEPVAECISPMRRTNFGDAVSDCTRHIQQQMQRRTAAA